jgi:PIN domain nuclease of toxin-antitoxin system
MKALIDTHLLLWAASEPQRLPKSLRSLLNDEANQIFFSAASIWETAIKSALNRPDFTVDPAVLRRNLIDNDYIELPISGLHASSVHTLPSIHKDPFDRILIAQAIVEGIVLITSDPVLREYSGPIQVI